jgi:hypothetical protein
MCSGMEISGTAWEKHKPQGTAGILYPPKANYTSPDTGLSIRRQEGYDAALCVQPALQDDGGGELVDDVAAVIAFCRIVTGCLESGVGLGGGEALVPEMDGERWVAGFCDEGFELVDEAMDPLGLAAGVSGEVERVADDDAGTVMAAGEAKDGALVAAGLRAIDGEKRLRDAENAGERDTDAARADIETEPRLLWAGHPCSS